MKRRWLIPLLLLSLGLNVGLLVVRFAPPRHRRPPPPPGMSDVLRVHLSRMTEDLGLSDEQRQDLQVVYDETFTKILEATARTRQTREELATYYVGPQFDTEELERILGRLNAAYGELDSLVSGTILREAAILTSEQRRRYLEVMPWRGNRQGGGPPPPGQPPHERPERGGERPPPPQPR